MGTKVRAIADGFAMGMRRRKGSEFTLPDGVKPGKWMEVLAKDVPAESKAAQEERLAAEKKAAEDADKAAIAKANQESRNIAAEPDGVKSEEGQAEQSAQVDDTASAAAAPPARRQRQQ
jgi:hypothetical protein